MDRDNRNNWNREEAKQVFNHSDVQRSANDRRNSLQNFNDSNHFVNQNQIIQNIQENVQEDINALSENPLQNPEQENRDFSVDFAIMEEHRQLQDFARNRNNFNINLNQDIREFGSENTINNLSEIPQANNRQSPLRLLDLVNTTRSFELHHTHQSENISNRNLVQGIENVLHEQQRIIDAQNRVFRQNVEHAEERIQERIDQLENIAENLQNNNHLNNWSDWFSSGWGISLGIIGVGIACFVGYTWYTRGAENNAVQRIINNFNANLLSILDLKKDINEIKNIANNTQSNLNQPILNNHSPGSGSGPFNMSNFFRQRFMITTGLMGFSHYCYLLFKWLKK